MSLIKKYLKSKPVCKVTFKLPKDIVNGAKKVSLAGEFNDWNIEKIKLSKKKDGSFSRVVDLPVGNAFQFRYLVDDKEWRNDPEADDYVSNGIDAQENCVVIV